MQIINIIDVDNYSNISVFNQDISFDDLIEISSNQEEDELLNNSLDFNKSVKTHLNLKIENENNQLDIIPEKNIPLKIKTKYNPPKISKLKPKQIFEPVSPMKLNIKFYGFDNSKNKQINEIVYNYSLNKNEAKSCNDEEINEDEIENFSGKKNNLKINELKKEMKNILNDFLETDNKSKEYENILNSDYIFVKKESNNSNQHHKKNKFWHKHIRQQQLKYRNQIFSSNLPRLSSDVNDVKRAETTINTENTKDHGLFILGILESAANERKGRNTVNV